MKHIFGIFNFGLEDSSRRSTSSSIRVGKN